MDIEGLVADNRQMGDTWSPHFPLTTSPPPMRQRTRSLRAESLERRYAMDAALAVSSADVNLDGNVTPHDALIVINHLSRQRASVESTAATNTAVPTNTAAAASIRLDVNGDGRLTPQDALQVINRLDAKRALTDDTPADDVVLADVLVKQTTGTHSEGASVAVSPTEIAELLRKMSANQVNLGGDLPAEPVGHSAAAYFWGAKSTGGYQLSLQSVRFEGSRALVTIGRSVPPPDAFVTQAITSPGILVQFNESVDSVTFLDSQGEVIAEA